MNIFLFGDPVAHSLSPLIHRAALDAAGLSWQYKAMQIATSELSRAVERCRAADVAGANVTIPHKQAIMPFLDRISPMAGDIGAVNVIYSGDEGTLEGDNTDAAGFTAPILSRGGLPSGSSVLVWGAGGAARAVIYACIHLLGAGRVYVASRSLEKAARLAAEMGAQGGSVVGNAPGAVGSAVGNAPGAVGRAVTPIPWDQVGDVIGDCALLVNATPLGMHHPGTTSSADHLPGMRLPDNPPVQDETPLTDLGILGPDTLVYDLVYAPARTLLLRQAEQAGAATIGGLEMLIAQAAPAFERWTGKKFPVEAVGKALSDAGFRRL